MSMAWPQRHSHYTQPYLSTDGQNWIVCMRVPIPHTFLWYMLQMPLSRSGKCDSRDLMEFKVTECDSNISCKASCLSEIDLRVHRRKQKKHGKSVDEGMQRIMTVQSQSPTKQTWHLVSWNVLTKMSCFWKRCYELCTNNYNNFFFDDLIKRVRRQWL